MLQDGIYEEQVDDSGSIATLVASAAPVRPPKDWFINPGLNKPTPLTVTSDGKIFGHIATWDTNHIGMPSETKPPRSNYDYAFFKTGVVATDTGEDVPVGQITLAGGHAPLNASAGEAVAHYDDTSSSVADVTAGEDGVGIWVSGALRPGVSDEQIRALRASAPSGDWRPINGNLELVAVCQVNTPGFPVARALAASGELVSLVAAGSRGLYALQQESALGDYVASLSSRVANLESHLESGALAAAAKVKNDDDEDVETGETEDDITGEDVETVEEDLDDYEDESDEDDDDDDDPVARRRAELRSRMRKAAS